MSEEIPAEALQRFGAEIFDVLFERFCEGDYEIEIHDLVAGCAVDAGLVSKTKFDPAIHSHEDAEPGDDYYEITPAGRKALLLSRSFTQDPRHG